MRPHIETSFSPEGFSYIPRAEAPNPDTFNLHLTQYDAVRREIAELDLSSVSADDIRSLLDEVYRRGATDGFKLGALPDYAVYTPQTQEGAENV